MTPALATCTLTSGDFTPPGAAWAEAATPAARSDAAPAAALEVSKLRRLMVIKKS
ncbi:hypothetical protein GOEFS_003_00020 [Gordonia effusa NBRC 100432]|uniref:Uncharacterized protein n=1 Tax=Gordonia effusa NBRC 100432 TaxID=1077974 RepID=H0QUH8_9ACTN|nr:hypothetical protein GOEFS_003_00020 [Gordonia effusa NBRC 100432]